MKCKMSKSPSLTTLATFLFIEDFKKKKMEKEKRKLTVAFEGCAHGLAFDSIFSSALFVKTFFIQKKKESWRRSTKL